MTDYQDLVNLMGQICPKYAYELELVHQKLKKCLDGMPLWVGGAGKALLGHPACLPFSLYVQMFAFLNGKK